MIRLAFAFLLSLCVSAQAQLSGGVGGFPGPGTAHTAAAAPAYAYIGATSSTGSGAGISQAFNLGSNSTCKVVVGVEANSNAPTVTVSVGGVGLTQDVTQAAAANSQTTFVFSKDLTTPGDCNGSKTVAMTSTAGSFTYRSVSVYVLTNTVSSTPAATGGYIQVGGTRTPTSPTISVTAGDLLFAKGIGLGAATITTCSGATVAPNTINAVGGASASDFMADWLIASTNASFVAICDSSSNNNSVSWASYR